MPSLSFARNADSRIEDRWRRELGPSTLEAVHAHCADLLTH